MALEKAISSIGAHLQSPYDSATLHRTNDYREILWATADSESTLRFIEGMFKSYLRIHKQIYGINPKTEDRPLSRENFSARLGNLKKESYGGVLENVPNKRGLYSYRENILRGFVAMKALELGIELHGDVPDEPKPIAMAKETRQSYVGKDFTPKVKFRGEK